MYGQQYLSGSITDTAFEDNAVRLLAGRAARVERESPGQFVLLLDLDHEAQMHGHESDGHCHHEYNQAHANDWHQEIVETIEQY